LSTSSRRLRDTCVDATENETAVLFLKQCYFGPGFSAHIHYTFYKRRRSNFLLDMHFRQRDVCGSIVSGCQR